jgi:hypothetical protein
MRKVLTASLAVILVSAIAQAQQPVSEASPAAAAGSIDVEQADAAAAPSEPAARPQRKSRARTAEGQTCSDRADAHNLRGKERQSFRRACIRELRLAARASDVTPPTPTAPALPAVAASEPAKAQ